MTTIPGMRAFRPGRALRLFPIALIAVSLVACDGKSEPKQKTVTKKQEQQIPKATSHWGAFLAARFAEGQRDDPAAANYYAEALQGDPNNERLKKTTFLMMLSAGRDKETIRLARGLTGNDEDFAIARLVLATVDARKGDFNAAAKDVEDLSGLQLGDVVSAMLGAWAYVGQGKTDRALASLAPIQNRQGVGPFYDFHAALIEDLAGNAKAAEKHFKDALGDQEEQRAPARLVHAIASFYVRHGRREEAKVLVAKQLEQQPSSVLLRETERIIDQGGKLPPVVASAADGVAEALFDLSSAYFRENAVHYAMIYARLSLMARPDSPMAQMLIGDILESVQRYREASEMYARIKPDSPFYWPAQINVANDLNQLGRTDSALRKLDAIAKQRPENPEPLIDMGDILRSKERFEEAAKAYDRAFKRIDEVRPYMWSLFYSRGIALERSKQWDRAEKDFKKALQLNPNQPYVLNYLGYSWVDRGENLQEAQKMIEKAVEQRPNDGYIVDSLGWVLYRLGKYGPAVEKLETAVELRPGDAVINDHLGDAYWRVGRRHEARVQWRRALSLKPDKDLIPKIQAKLENGLPPAQGPGASQD